jgi:hypothetical protein
MIFFFDEIVRVAYIFVNILRTNTFPEFTKRSAGIQPKKITATSRFCETKSGRRGTI